MTTLAALLGMTLIKGTLVLATAIALGAALYRAPGMARHRLWSVAFAGLLLLPALALLLPPLPVPYLPASLAIRSVASTADPGAAAAAVASESRRNGPVSGTGLLIDTQDVVTHNEPQGNAEAEADPAAVSDRLSRGGVSTPTTAVVPWHLLSALVHSFGLPLPWLAGTAPALSTGLLLLWLAGAGAGVLYLAAGLLRCVALTRSARPLDDAAWRQDLEWHRNFFGIRRRVRLLQSPHVRTPLTGGILRPVVLVPEGAGAWPAARRRVVLLHELVHVRRFDVVRHLLARLCIAAYWFHPLAWLAGRSSAIAREQACDEEVLRLGVKPSVYAAHLLALAETLDTGRPPAVALPMIQRSQLEKRLMTILDAEKRPRAAWTSALAAAFMLLTAVSAGMAAPQEPQRPTPVVPSGPMIGGSPLVPLVPIDAPSLPPIDLTMLTMPGLAGEAPSLPPVTHVPGQTPTTCWPDGSMRVRGRFSGSISTDDVTGRRVVNAVGTRDGDYIVQRFVDDLRLCMVVHGDVVFADGGARLDRVEPGGTLVLEAELVGDELQRLVIRNDGDGEQVTWTVDGTSRPVTAEVEQWRDRMIAALDDYAAIMELRGQRSSLRGEISSIRGQRSSLQGQISSVRGQRSSLQGEISSVQGRRSSLQGQISSAQGHVSSLQGRISSAQGHVSSLHGRMSSLRSALQGFERAREGASDEELAVIEAAIRRRQEEIGALQRQIEEYDLEGRVAEIRHQIEEYELEGRIAEVRARMENDIEAQVAEVQRRIEELAVEERVAAIREQIEALDVEGKVAAIEAEIEAMNVDERVEEIERRLEPALRELRRTIEAIGR